jgi:type VII secretion-associated serine protease mycosin
VNLALRRSIAAAAVTVVISGSSVFGAPARGADDISDGQWYVDYLNLSAAHQISQGEGMKVAVIDSGVDANHPDLQGSVASGADFSSDGEGDELTDTDGHGTSMASLIAGHGAIKGVAPRAIVVSVRMTSGGPGGGRGSMGAAIQWAVKNGIKILSISSSADTPDLLTEQSIQEAAANNVVIVAAAGNKPGQSTIGYPAIYSGVLAVSGLGRNGELSDRSVTGQQVSIAAPSDGVSVAYKNLRRVVSTGTSNSTALTAGAVALVWAKYPDLSAADVVHRLTATATDKGASGRDPEYGYGALNLVAALTADVPRLPTQTTTAPTTTEVGTSSPIPAPGAEFPTGIALAVGLACLVAVLILVAILFFVIRSRRRA